jgi:hypothetical protein
MSRWIKRLALVGVIWAAAGSGASAQDVYAIANGSWNSASTWNTGTVPGSSNNVFIGSTAPGVAIVTVNLTQSQTASNLTVGNGSSTSGTLALGSNTLAVSNALTIGLNGGLGLITRTTGSFTAATVNVESGNAFTFGSGDVTATLNAFSSSNVTTAATGNVTTNVNVFSGSTLNLGANLSLGAGQLDVENTGSVLNLNGFNASAANILIGQFSDQPVTVLRGATPGSLTATNLDVAANTLNLLATDMITNLRLSQNAQVTTGARTLSSLSLAVGSTLNVQQTSGTGLTISTASPGLSIDSTSVMHLVFTSSTPGSWDFRWADPTSGNWISTLNGLIASGNITIATAPGSTTEVVDTGGFTYIELGPAAVPEPSSFLLGCLGIAGAAMAAWPRRPRGPVAPAGHWDGSGLEEPPA